MTDSDHQHAAVLFSDIVGYTSMMQENEQAAIETANRYQSVLEETVPRFEGQVVQHYGDGSLSVFKKPEGALGCALELQRKLRSSVPLRMGIHYGKVVHHQGKVFGETVNVASRIESLGQPGTVLFSLEVLDGIKDIQTFQYRSVGQYKFKNVGRKMEVFALTNEGLYVPTTGKLEGKLDHASPRTAWLVFLGILIMFAGVLAVFYFSRPEIPRVVPANYENSIAVLPFSNLSADSTQDYFAEGLAEELLSMLTQVPQLRVTSRSSSFAFKGKQVDIPSIARQLGVKYVLEGSVRKAGNSIRISTQLINAQSDRQLWAQTWQRELQDVFSVQNEIADSVKTALKLQILADNQLRILETDPQAYTLYLQAKHIGQTGVARNLPLAEDLIIESLKIDSSYAPAWGYLGHLINRQANIGAIPTVSGRERARLMAYRAIQLDSTQTQPWAILGSIAIYYDRDFEKARTYVKKARETEPGGITGLKLASNLAFCLGDIQEAIRLDQQAIAIDPVSAKNYLDLGFDYFYAGRPAEAEKATRQGLTLNPDYLAGQYLLSLILMQQGKFSEAKKAANQEPYDILKTQARALVASAMGETDSSRLFLGEMITKHAHIAPYQIAQVYGHQQKVDSAFYWLNRAYNSRDGGLVQMKADPLLTALHKDRRWSSFLKKVGLS